jgi:hypothetical protein
LWARGFAVCPWTPFASSAWVERRSPATSTLSIARSCAPRVMVIGA